MVTLGQIRGLISKYDVIILSFRCDSCPRDQEYADITYVPEDYNEYNVIELHGDEDACGAFMLVKLDGYPM